MIHHTFLKTLKRYAMLRGIRRLFVASSGGPDSTALLRLFLENKNKFACQLGALHVNHKLRGPSSDKDEKFVRKMSGRFDIPFLSGSISVKTFAKKHRLSIEESARELRYRFFVQMAKRHKIDAIALAHTQDDQAETVLMRMLTGTGMRGLASSRPVFTREGVRFIRPLIDTAKKEILQYLKRRKIPYRIDRSNLSNVFFRNRLRNQFIPKLEKMIGRNIKKTLSRIPESVQMDLDFIDSKAAALFKKLSKQSENRVSFSSRSFLKLPKAIQFRLLRFAVIAIKKDQQFEMKDFDLKFEHWQAWNALTRSGKHFQVSFSRGVVCSSDGRNIIISSRSRKSHRNAIKTSQLDIGETRAVPSAGMMISCTALLSRPRRFMKKSESYAMLDRDAVQFPLTIRTRTPGDRFQPLGQNKPSKLKDFLIRRKIPQSERDNLPLVCSGDQIIWIPQVALSDSVKLTRESKRVIKLTSGYSKSL